MFNYHFVFVPTACRRNCVNDFIARHSISLNNKLTVSVFIYEKPQLYINPIFTIPVSLICEKHVLV